MARTFKAKIRKVGTSLGVLIPKDIAEAEKIKEGDEVAVSILKGRKINEVLKLFGTAGRTRSFERDRKDRSNRY
jgi:antitoxin component of MazEF toxin-antitoxin module